MFSAYILCATPRSGSTLLCDMLTASGMAGIPHSYFRPESIGEWASLWGVDGSTAVADPEFNRAYLCAMRRAGTDSSGIFGLRLMWRSIDEATRRLDAASSIHADLKSHFQRVFGPTLFIYLSRLDKVAQAISLVRAEQTGLWHVGADGTERERTAPAKAPVFDARRILQARDDRVSDDGAWASFFDQRGIVPMCLTYEGLATDPRSVLANILAALGRDPTSALDICPVTARMTDATSSQWAERMKYK